MDELIEIYGQQSEAAPRAGAGEKLNRHLFSHVLCQERHTITGLLKTAGRQERDWSGDYRLYGSQIDIEALFLPLQHGVLKELGPKEPLVVAVDDSLLPKSGRKIPAVGWYRDPLGPPFHTNLAKGLKFVQFSAAVADPNNPRRARMIPIAFETIEKMPKLPAEASEEQKAQYEQDKENNSPSSHAVGLLKKLRQRVDEKEPHRGRTILLCGDGHYSTETVLQNLPPKTHYIGRIRGDTHLRAVPKKKAHKGKGRPPSYGEKLPTPDELRKDKQTPWETLTIEKADSLTTIRYKHIKRAKWHKAGEKKIVQVVVIAPFRYKNKKNGPWLYTRPAYLICTDPNLPVQKLIQTYLWRWDIEVNFPDEKQLFGASHAQVRRPNSVASAPAVSIAAYGGLLLAALRVFGFTSVPLVVSVPKWRRPMPTPRPTTNDLLSQLKHEAAARSLALANFSDFSFADLFEQKSQKIPPPSTRPSQSTAA